MIIVTGAAGFVGSNLVKGLNEMGIVDIIIVDNLEIAEKHLNLNRLKFTDFIDEQKFFDHFDCYSDARVIFHQGACSDTMEQDGRYMMENNYEYSKRLMEISLNNDIRFIYASSASVYGNGDDGFSVDPKCEYPLNVYAFSKFAFDNYVRKMVRKSDPQVVGLRYFNVYGPNENHKGRMASVIFHFFNQAKKDGVVRPFEGSEAFLRDFVWVKDAVDVNLFFLDNPEKKGIFNCGTGNTASFQQIAEIVANKMGAKIEHAPFPEALKGKYQAYTKADLTGLRAAGYDREFTAVEKGVEAYLDILESTGGYIK